MKTPILALGMPLLLLAAAFAGVAPHASAQESSTYTVSGRVVSDAGEPLAGAHVNGYTYAESKDRKIDPRYQHAEAVTDKEGRFTLRLAAGKGNVNVWYPEWRVGDGKEIAVEGDVSDLVLTLKTPPPRTARVEGRVVAPDGSPIAGATVTLSNACCYAMPAAETLEKPTPREDVAAVEPAIAPSRPIMPPQYDDHQTATTDADGRFAFKAYAGPRQLSAWAKGYAQTTQEITTRDNETTEVTLRLEKPPARDAILTGRVLDASTGLPIQGAHVAARSLSWGRYAEARTGADGSFRIETLPGWTEISVNVWPSYEEPQPLDPHMDALLTRPVASSAPQYYAYSMLVKLASGENGHDARLLAKPKPTIALIGYVVDPDAKKGVPGARVNVWSQDTGDWGEAVTDATGSFKILVRAGHYTGNAWKDGYLGGTRSFVVREEPTQRVDLFLPAGQAKWVPCDEDCAVVAYESKAAAAGAPPPVPIAASDGARGASVETADAPRSPGASGREGQATFAGSGGGLPPYDPDASTRASGNEAAMSEVPAAGLFALLAVAAVGALAMRRK